ncbi:acetyl-CoA acetyltransferase [Nocardia sp. NPDC051030]|uniref:thiolase family protein n=1 Tax=Nocardia sp. NPDC051030 TaxID=3155162 RepID=UPI003449FF1F
MKRAAIVMPMRTPVGLPGGALAAVAPQRLIATAMSAIIGRSGVDPFRIEQIVTAVPCADAVRAAMPIAGLSAGTVEFPIGSGPGSGLRALITAAMMVQTGSAEVVLALGAEYHTGASEFGGAPTAANRMPRHDPGGGNGLDTGEQVALWAAAEPARGQRESEQAELLARRFGISRHDADEFAAASHRRAARARRQGIFGAETAPVVVCATPDDMNSDVVQLVDRDEGLRDDVSPRAFAALEPLHPGGVITIGNSSARTLAASGCLVVAEDRLADLGLEPMGYLVDWAAATGELAAEVPAAGLAVDKALTRSGFDLHDLDLVEIEETSAVEVLALTRMWELEGWKFDAAERLNVHGAAIALGDPGGASGLRMITTLLHELSRREGGHGLVATPTGPSQALAAVFESGYSVPVAPTPRGARFHGVRKGRSGRHRPR